MEENGQDALLTFLTKALIILICRDPCFTKSRIIGVFFSGNGNYANENNLAKSDLQGSLIDEQSLIEAVKKVNVVVWYWLLAHPCYAIVTVVAIFMVYISLNFMETPTSLNLIYNPLCSIALFFQRTIPAACFHAMEAVVAWWEIQQSLQSLTDVANQEDLRKIRVWIKFHDLSMAAFNGDGLSIIALKLGTPMLLDSYTITICEETWGRNSYARALIELNADNVLKD
ncbi:hypothetical protein Tco_0600757 [Tanacetum coccineum]